MEEECLLKVRICEIIQQTDGIRSFLPVPYDADTLPPVTPGSYIDVYLAERFCSPIFIVNDSRHRCFRLGV